MFEVKRKQKKNEDVGTVVDTYKGVDIFSNGRVRNVHGRNITKDGYNLGLKYQCVEYVNRFYYEVYGHKMPNSYGHAKEFFNENYTDGSLNTERGMYQYSNPSIYPIKKDALLVYGPTPYNSFGHVAIVTETNGQMMECISQNLGEGNGTRRTYQINKTDRGMYSIEDPYIIGWLSL